MYRHVLIEYADSKTTKTIHYDYVGILSKR